MTNAGGTECLGILPEGERAQLTVGRRTCVPQLDVYDEGVTAIDVSDIADAGGDKAGADAILRINLADLIDAGDETV